MGYQFHFNVVEENWQYLVGGFGISALVTFWALALGLAVGIIIGIGRMSRFKPIAWVCWAYTEVMRNTPVLVQLVWVYYCIPILTGLDTSVIVSCVIALSLQSAAFIGEIVRGGIRGVDPGQIEAARTVGLSSMQTMRKVILPQALRRMLAPLVNEAVSLVKSSSLVSVLGVADITYRAQLLATTTFRPIEIFTFLALEYLLVCSLLSYAARRLELRLSRSD